LFGGFNGTGGSRVPSPPAGRRCAHSAGQIAFAGIASFCAGTVVDGALVTGGMASGSAGSSVYSETGSSAGAGGGLAVSYSSPGSGRDFLVTVGGAFDGGAANPW
jgi:hypothetical protein